MNSVLTKAKENARNLLFADFEISPDKAKLYLDDMDCNPEKSPKYAQLLRTQMSKIYETFKDKPLEEINKIAKQRVEEWTQAIGPVSIPEFVTMSKQWNIPIDAFIDRSITPELIKEMLDFFLVGQEKYKIMLSVSFYCYIMTCKYPNFCFPKSNLLVCGPSGSGKTYGMQVLTQLFHVPFVVVHCNSLVQEGIIGQNITDSFTSLLSKGWQVDDIKQTVVCFDEFDKLFDKTGTYNARIVDEMLNIIDDKGEVEFKKSYESNSERIKISTQKMMFVFTGVFEGLRNEKKEQRESNKNNRPILGFGRHVEPSDEVQNLTIEDEPSIDDFIRFGVKPEIIGRVRNFVFLDSLTEEQMVRLFSFGVNSPFNDFEQYFSQNGIETILTEEGIHTLAKLACERKLGVRGLKSLIQQVLLEDMYDLEVGQDNILRVTKQYIMDNLNK